MGLSSGQHFVRDVTEVASYVSSRCAPAFQGAGANTMGCVTSIVATVPSGQSLACKGKPPNGGLGRAAVQRRSITFFKDSDVLMILSKHQLSLGRPVYG